MKKKLGNMVELMSYKAELKKKVERSRYELYSDLYGIRDKVGVVGNALLRASYFVGGRRTGLGKIVSYSVMGFRFGKMLMRYFRASRGYGK